MKYWKVAACCTLLVVLTPLYIYFRPAITAHQSLEKSKSVLHDADAAQHMRQALDQLGISETGFTGAEWGVEGCVDHVYFVRLDKEPSFFFLRNKVDGRIEHITAPEVDRELRRHFSYLGFIDGSTLAVDDQNVYYWLGAEPDQKLPVDVFVRFSRTACGLVADEVWYRGIHDSRKVPVSIQLLPSPKSND